MLKVLTGKEYLSWTSITVTYTTTYSNNQRLTHMKNYIYGFGTVALTLAMGILPTVTFADNSSGGQGGLNVGAGITAQVQSGGISTSASTSISTRSREGQRYGITGSGGQNDSNRLFSTGIASRTNGRARESARRGIEKALEIMDNGLPFSLEGTTTAALSFGQLKLSIEARQRELNQEEASSSPGIQSIMKNMNPVRLAVHSLLASKDLLGGIGGQVSVIAQQMNDSIASTTNAEAQIQSRGFFTKLFFGGDTTAAQIITEQVAQNQQRIDALTKLLAQANISVNVQTILQAQITALQEAQTRLQVLAQQQQHMWGLFSWRF